MALKLRILGHATLALFADGAERPLLITDPWLIGSCYWRSWWLQRPPSAEEIAWLACAERIYLTHEHPDHLHLPSLRRLKREAPAAGPQVLTPDFPRMTMDGFLAGEGFRVERAPSRRWLPVAEGVRIMSLPVLTNDSVLLIDTPKALLVNQNDVKPGQRFMRALGRFTRSLGKPVVLLRSHSPAGPALSFFRDGKRLPAAPAEGYVRSAGRHADAVGASWFIPFASQAVFRRADSAWANDYRVDQEILQRHWRSRARLLPPFVTLDLETFEHSAPPPAQALPPPSPAAQSRIAELADRDRSERLDEGDVARLQAILNEERLAILAILPRGLAFQVGPDSFLYDPRRGSLVRAAPGDAETDGRAAARIVAPAATFREALAFGHVADLFIGMFMDIHLDADTDPRRFTWFYYLMMLRDYGYGGVWRRLRWALWAWRGLNRPIPPPPAG